MRSELATRSVTGAIAAVVAALAVYQGGAVFFLFVAILAFVMSLEFDKLRGDGKISFLFCAVPILISMHPGFAVGMALLTAVAVTFMRSPWLVVSVVYITIPAIALISLRTEEYGMQAVFWLVIVIVATDTGAYFTGRAFGKHLLAPSISPKKTWEGLAGGAALAAIAGWAYTGQVVFIPVGLVFAVVGQLGDLSESAIKRYFGVKDTGSILPGHGGAMDRLDGLLYAAPLAALAAYSGVLAW